jgi:hypothetical protein
MSLYWRQTFVEHDCRPWRSLRKQDHQCQVLIVMIMRQLDSKKHLMKLVTHKMLPVKINSE